MNSSMTRRKVVVQSLELSPRNHLSRGLHYWHTDTAVRRDGLLITTRLMTAVDLLDSADARSVSAGRRLLQEALQSLTLSKVGG